MESGTAALAPETALNTTNDVHWFFNIWLIRIYPSEISDMAVQCLVDLAPFWIFIGRSPQNIRSNKTNVSLTNQNNPLPHLKVKSCQTQSRLSKRNIVFSILNATPPFPSIISRYNPHYLLCRFSVTWCCPAHWLFVLKSLLFPCSCHHPSESIPGPIQSLLCIQIDLPSPAQPSNRTLTLSH